MTTPAEPVSYQRRNLVLLFIGAVAVVAFPWLPIVSFSVLGSANLAAYYALVAVSLVVLTGWVGQISLGHAGLVGVGAYVTGHVVNGWGVTFPVNLLWAGIAGGLVATLLGAVAVRVRGLYLAVATLIFSWMAVEFLFRQAWFTKNGSIQIPAFGKVGTLPYFDFNSRRTFYYAAWATVIAAVYLMANLRDSKTGRAFFAVRGSEVAAASMGISVVRTKLTAFAISGALAGMAGNLLIIRDQVITGDSFKVEVSLFFLAVAVVGGLSSLGGAIAAAILFASLNELFFQLEFLAGWLEVVPPLLLTIVLLAYRGGLAAIPASIQRHFGGPFDTYSRWMREDWFALQARWYAWRDARRSRNSAQQGLDSATTARRTVLERMPAPVKVALQRLRKQLHSPSQSMPRLDLAAILDPPAGIQATHVEAASVELPAVSGTWQSLDLPQLQLPASREDRKVLIELDGVTVRFGGLVAVNDVSLTVREHEIVGLIGPNGAGKTTTFNSIAGLNVPAAGRVMLLGQDVTDWSVDQRSRLGVGRTFQAVQLLPQLSVFDNLLVATHLQNPSSLVSHLFVGTSTLRAEKLAREQVRRVARLLELETHLDRTVADLPFGVLRMVELARALVTSAPLIMLDEPASGLDSTETDRLAAILRVVRDLGVTLLLIEHDVKMVTSVSDYMYVLNQGGLLAEGTSADVQRDPAVIAAYLGEPPADEVPASGELAGADR